ncbi:GNAT family N-acetyltransferase [Robbsia sp. Bb-Pol-6]|uniref:GNAT family N-acetyltransferase n=1 Tax=Robbsia betulipollinis TaxID=2981849 RepID=A0ABT3ZJY2_9BURK|nr:GNAT family N-acetyltransferase [Robbsia betulipollinis]MCY0386839.1 GNAT family N-acetyltransferase [Robbsia betulipollinis]
MQAHPPLTYEPACDDDFDALAQLRIAAMRESLEAVGRFDPERARARLRAGFRPQDTRHVVLSGKRVGFYALTQRRDHWALDHFYLHPEQTGHGLGSRVLADIARRADLAGMPVRLGALRGSRSNGFYAARGFVVTGEDEYDIHYVRQPHAGS